jgi:acetylornithine deacetylase
MTAPFTELLCRLIETPSFSREEADTARLIAGFWEKRGVPVQKIGHNVVVFNRWFDAQKPTVLLNSHHDTVKPNVGYTRQPFEATIENGRLYGLGSNDAGGPLVALMAAFWHFYERTDLPFNLCMAATAEEECSGKNGIESVWPHLPPIAFAIVGEPTQMHLAVAEKGLMVLDCTVTGKAGHAAREEGDNAIYRALPDIEWFRTFEFPKISAFLGQVKMSVTVIQAGQQHNVVPDRCTFTVDVRATDAYTLEEILDIIRQHVACEVVPRSVRLRPSAIVPDHPFVQTGVRLGRHLYGSPTLSDQALIPCASVKMGPGDSARSHTADEYIELAEIEEGVQLYIKCLEGLAAIPHLRLH